MTHTRRYSRSTVVLLIGKCAKRRLDEVDISIFKGDLLAERDHHIGVFNRDFAVGNNDDGRVCEHLAV